VADRTVYYAKITREHDLWTESHTFRDDIEVALNPDRPVTRYRKTWHVSEPEVIEDRYIAGELGFERTSARNATTWDPDSRHFVTTEGVATEGSFANFVIDTEREIIGFETIGPDIALKGFLGALKKLLTDEGMRVRVELLADPRGWADFVASVDRVVRVRAVVYDPNPKWRRGSENLRAIVEESNAQKAEVTATAPKDGELNAGAQWIDAAIQHVAEHGDGDVKATAIDNGRKSTWSLKARLQVDVVRDEDAIAPAQVRSWILDRLRRLYGGA
jgi:hypothetical protein